MPYKTRRQARYENLRKCGFVNFEARGMSRVSQRVPYMLPMLKERFTEYSRAVKRAKQQGMSEVDFHRQWLTFIKRRYIMKGWKNRGDAWGVTVAYRMVKAVERDYKYKHPQYDSPWVKRQKAWKDFIAKIDASYEKYPRGKAYGGKRQPTVRLRYKPEGGAEEIRE